MKRYIVWAVTLLFVSSCAKPAAQLGANTEYTAGTGRYSISRGKRSAVKREGENDSNESLKEFKRRNDETAVRSRDIAKAVEGIEGVEKSSVLITGNTAVVGVTLSNELSDERFLDLKHIIESKVTAFDAEIKHVAITSSRDIIRRIAEINGY